MQKNKQFAKLHKLPVDSDYAVAPHHSGVYPVHRPLYDAWKEVWNISITSTEQYPRFSPAYGRRGFVYRGIKVLPRQTCGVYTKTIQLNDYPGGKHILNKMILGGSIFDTILFNPVNIYMTHMSNYGGDRLAIYVFEALFSLFQHWTNFELLNDSPNKVAEAYFQQFPSENAPPVWVAPCGTRKHREIWPAYKSCALPNLLIVGPQKTGTSALLHFLSIHPNVEVSAISKITFEEIQFFSNERNYAEGLDWYMNFFPQATKITADAVLNGAERILIDKSANYFDHPSAPYRAHMLLPFAKIVILLEEPGRRAYSWYQHQRAHSDPIALQYSFHEVISFHNQQHPMKDRISALQRRCLEPGKYIQHLYAWLKYYPMSQFIFVDSGQLRVNPDVVLSSLQLSFSLVPKLDYANLLSFDEKKGYFCLRASARRSDTSVVTRCLGSGKGRVYEVMSNQSRLWLNVYYNDYNQQLRQLLVAHSVFLPVWLH